MKRDDGDVDLVCRAEQPDPLVGAQVNQRVSAEPHHAGPQLQASALSVTEPLQLRHKALLVHQEAGLPHPVSQGRDLKSLTAPISVTAFQPMTSRQEQLNTTLRVHLSMSTTDSAETPSRQGSLCSPASVSYPLLTITAHTSAPALCSSAPLAPFSLSLRFPPRESRGNLVEESMGVVVT
ncbi:hypothetical protein F7725_006598 [Dissostichus mawsoni]|uniref:Uncharacterized protein n=1 Tax=Dissostichus mawsoni TaxID=36200 RepID=A0A7J5XUC9_DISMA|nr:hypothetical protein F7725_006598 [Dissostichus mawsoni]